MMKATSLLSLFDVSGFDSPHVSLYDRRWIHCENCPACGGAIIEKAPQCAKVKVGTGGTRWPDVLFDLDGLILHERVCETLKAEKFRGFNAHPVTITEIKSKKLAAIASPQYYLIEITGRIDIDQSELDDVGGSVCQVCFRRNAEKGNPYRWKPKRLVPKLDTWDGSDFVTLRNLLNARHFCSRRFIELANKNKWTNFIFGESLPGVALWEKAPKEVDGLSYLDPAWFEKLSERVKAKHPDLFA